MAETASVGPPAEIYTGLRQRMLSEELGVLKVDLESRGVSRMVVVDIGAKEGVATFVAFADGTASMNTSTGGGIIGAGQHETVRRAAYALLREADSHWNELAVVQGVALLPAADRVRFTVRRPAETRSIELRERGLIRRRSSLSSLNEAARTMITEIRLFDEQPNFLQFRSMEEDEHG